MAEQPEPEGFTAFIVYDPPAYGLPWLTVGLGPDGQVVSCEAFDAAGDAHVRAADLALEYIRELPEFSRVGKTERH